MATTPLPSTGAVSGLGETLAFFTQADFAQRRFETHGDVFETKLRSLVSNTSPWVSKRRWAKSAWVKKARVSPSPLTAPVLGRGVVAIAARRELMF